MATTNTAPITEDDIARLVKVFYARVRKDEVLAPIFSTKIAEEDWPRHIDHIASFWSSIFLKSGRFNGNPMVKHGQIAGLTPEHFSHWVALFKDTAEGVLDAGKAAQFGATADRIAKSLQMGLAFNFAAKDGEENPFANFGARRGDESKTL